VYFSRVPQWGAESHRLGTLLNAAKIFFPTTSLLHRHRFLSDGRPEADLVSAALPSDADATTLRARVAASATTPARPAPAPVSTPSPPPVDAAVVETGGASCVRVPVRAAGGEAGLVIEALKDRVRELVRACSLYLSVCVSVVVGCV
jgi:hypothetical protein